MRNVWAALDLLERYPEIGAVQPGRRCRKLNVRGFPYGIFYTYEHRGVMVFGIADLRQDLEYLWKRLE